MYAVLFLAGLAAAALAFDAELSQSGDNAEYIILARSLVQGEGLRGISTPDPEPSTKFPPFLPALLAAIEWVSPGNILAMKWLVVLFFAGSIPLIYRLFLPHSGQPLALLVAGSCLLSPYLLASASQVMSEVPFLCVSMAALVAASRDDRSWRSLLLILGLLMAAYYIRTAAIALIVSVLLYDALKRDWRSVGVIAGGSVLLALPWSLYVSANGGGVYGEALMAIDPYRPHLGTIGPTHAISRVLQNIHMYVQLHLGRTIVPFLSEDKDAYLVWDGIGHGVLVLCGIASYVRLGARRQVTLPALYLFIYTGMLLCWPQAWGGIRFLVPVAPLLFHAVYDGGRWLLGFLPPSVPVRTVSIVLAAGILGANVVSDAAMLRGRRELPTSWRDYYASAEWLRTHSPPDALVACRKPHLLYLRSNRKAVRYAFNSPEYLVRDLVERGATHLVADTFGEFDSNIRFLYPALKKYADLFTPVRQFPSASVLTIDPDPAARYQALAPELLNAGKPVAAAQAFQKLYDLYPERDPPLEEAPVLLDLADSSLAYADTALARGLLARLLPLTDPVVTGQPVDRPRLEVSARVYGQLLRLDGDNAEFRNARAISILQLGQLREGVRLLRDLCIEFPRNAQYATNLATGLVMADRLEDAVAVLENVTRQSPENARAFWMLGDVEEMRGNSEAASRARETARRLGQE